MAVRMGWAGCCCWHRCATALPAPWHRGPDPTVRHRSPTAPLACPTPPLAQCTPLLHAPLPTWLTTCRVKRAVWRISRFPSQSNDTRYADSP